MTAVDPRRRPRGFLLLVLAVGLLLVGAPLPWFRAAGEAISGVDHGDGVVTAGVAVAAVTAAIAFEWGRYARAGVALGGALALWVAVETYRRVAAAPNHDPAIGLWLTALGALVLVAAAIAGTVGREPERPIVVVPESPDVHGEESGERGPGEQVVGEAPEGEEGSGREGVEAPTRGPREGSEHEPADARESETGSAEPPAEDLPADDGEGDPEREEARGSGRE